MIRTIQRRLIIPRGDTGSFSIPLQDTVSSGDVAVFSIFDSLTRTTVHNINIPLTGEEEVITIPFIREDTINLVPKKYLWDLRIYHEPQFDNDGNLTGGSEINSYYSAFSLPVCEIREVAEDVPRTQENTRSAT